MHKNNKNNSTIKISWLSRAQNLGITLKEALIVVFLTLMMTATEILGLGIFLPIFQFIRLEGDLDALVADTNIWKYAVDAFEYLNIEISLALLLFLAFIFFLTRQVFAYLGYLFRATVQHRLIQKQRNYVFNQYLKANSSYHDSIHLGNLLNIIQTEVSRAVACIMTPLDLRVTSIMCLGYLLMVSALSLQMTFLSVLVFLVVSLIPIVWIKKSKKIGRKLVKANTIMSEFLVGRLKSPRLVRLSGTENAEQQEFYRVTLQQRKNSIRSVILKIKTETVLEPIIIGLSLVILYFAHTVLHLKIEVIGLYLVIAMRLMPVVKTLFIQIQSIQNLAGSMEALENRINSMMDALEVDNGSKILTKLEKYISLDRVSYCYQNSKSNALKNITIKIEVNKMTAIVGPSGSGKSTLIDLLPRLRLPIEGIIQIDDESIVGYTLDSLRGSISYVPQTPQIFDGTVKDHVLYGKKNANTDDVKKALYMAGAEAFVEQLPQGVDTELGDNAIRLSGGQRQRLDLARALVKEASVLILDEPTSNLDVDSEKAFMQVISEIREKTDTTIIIVSHNLSSISSSDQIVVLNKGRVEAVGVHSELLKEKGWYSKAWKTQNLHK